MGKRKFSGTSIQKILTSGGIKSARARELTGWIIDAMTAALAAGEPVEIRGFGTLETKDRKARKAHNPRTMEPVIVSARRRVIFRPGQKLKILLQKEG
jgi:integration host factor subunit alpha